MSLLGQTEREMALTEEIAHKFDIKGAEKSDTEGFPEREIGDGGLRVR